MHYKVRYRMTVSLTGFICNRNEKAVKAGVYGSKSKRSLMRGKKAIACGKKKV